MPRASLFVFHASAKRLVERMCCDGKHGLVATGIAIAVNFSEVSKVIVFFYPAYLFITVTIFAVETAGKFTVRNFQTGTHKRNLVRHRPVAYPILCRRGDDNNMYSF